jgi:hypothetical protein
LQPASSALIFVKTLFRETLNDDFVRGALTLVPRVARRMLLFPWEPHLRENLFPEVQQHAV